jgi:mono/diheme cytochrome c family protein
MKLAVAFILAAGLFAAEGKTTWDGVYTEAQAKRGEEVYGNMSSSCHGPELAGADTAPSLTGPEFNSGWNDLTADDLAERVRTTMPGDAPGSLTREQVADVIAFLLAKDKFPAGSTELPTASEQLKQIKFLAQKP